ncbi:glycosyltransferase family 39 protein [bacterium]|nr:glycosyltransferase family 39 protein [bacterium]
MLKVLEKYHLTSLYVVIIIATVFRLIGLFHGITFHPDERSNIMHVMDMSWSDLNPHFFAYGSLPFYILFIVKMVLGWFSAELVAYTALFKIGRVISALIGIWTCVLTSMLGKRLSDRPTGLLAGLFLALTVLHIQYSHFYAVDIMMTFMATLVCLKLLDLYKRGRWRDYILTGIFLGMGLAVKVSILPIMLPVLFSHVFRAIDARNLLKVRTHVPFIVLTIVMVMCFMLCQPYTCLDYAKFSHDVLEQSRMVTGEWKPPYTLQYEQTRPFLYPLEQMMKWSMGYPLFLISMIGFISACVGLRKKWISAETLIILWIIPYFLITGSFQVKFLRYLLPIMPMLCVFGANWLVEMVRSGPGVWRSRLGYALLSITLVYLICYALAFSAIYREPHPYYTASDWIYQHVAPHEIILTEHWDDGLPISLPSRSGRMKTQVMNMYEPDRASKTSEIARLLESGDYIVQATRRLSGSIGKLTERYPISSRYYRLLLSGKLGFRLVRTFQTYPSLLGYEFIDDQADESFSVYDHPKVSIFRKEVSYTAQELETILNTSLGPQFFLGYDDLVRARTFRDQVYHPFEADRSLASLFRFYLFVLLSSLLALPMSHFLCQGREELSYALARVLGLTVPVYLVWLLSTSGYLSLERGSIVLAYTLFFILCYAFSRYRTDSIVSLFKRMQGRIITGELIFAGCFVVFVIIRAFNPEIFWGEKPMDFSFLNACYRADTLPLEDPWFAGKNVNYYYFGYFLAAIPGRLLGIAPAVIYNLFIALLPAVSLSLYSALLLLLIRRPWLSILGGIYICLGSNLYAFFQYLWHHHKLNFDLWWASSRILPSPVINEYPVWSFLFADLHAHVMSFPLTLVVLVFVVLLLYGLSERRTGRSVISGLVLSFFLALISMTNTWDHISWSCLLGAALLLVWIPRDRSRAASGKDGKTWSARMRSSLCTLGLDISKRTLVLVTIVIVSFILVCPFYVSFESAPPSYGKVDSGFASIHELVLHFGHFLLPIAFLVIYDVLFRTRSRFWYDFLPLSHEWKPGRSFIRTIVCLVVMIVLYCAVAWFERSGLVLGIVLLILSLVCLFTVRRSLNVRIAALLLFFCGAVIVATDLYFISDRMNTIFKFYYPLWPLFGIALMIIVGQCGPMTALPGLSGQEQAPVTCLPIQRRKVFSHEPVAIFLALLLISTSFFGTIFGAGVVVSGKRVKPLRPTLDGRKYMVLYTPEDYVCTRWLNENVTGRPVIAEAHGASYQQYGRISMHTGLPTVLGWEYHVIQRGAAHQEIKQRKADLEILYTTDREDLIAAIIDRYQIQLIYFGQLERELDPKSKRKGLPAFPELYHPVFSYGQTTIYQVHGQVTHPHGADLSDSAASSRRTWTDSRKRPKLKDWSMSTTFALDELDLPTGRLTGISIGPKHIFVADMLNNTIYELDQNGRFQRRLPLETLLPPLDTPTFLHLDDQERLWIADTGNSRLVRLDLVRNETSTFSPQDHPFRKPAGLTHDTSGYIYLADNAADTIYRITPETGQISVMTRQVPGPLGLDYLAPDRLAVYSMTDRAVYLVTLNGGPVEHFSLGEIKGFSPVEGTVLVNEAGVLAVIESGLAQFRQYKPNGDMIRELPIELQSAVGLAQTADNCYWIVDSRVNSVTRLCAVKARTMFKGGGGFLPGQFDGARGLALDSHGNFYVADTRNNRIQKFDPQGNYVLQWGEQGEQTGQFNEPMGVAVGPDDLIYVADTWNQRIQVFDSEGTFVRSWEDSFYGPRAVAVFQERVYVADTGNHVVRLYSLAGNKLGVFGGKGTALGEFKEPIGLAAHDDRLYVCDTLNARLQVFSLEGVPLQEFALQDWDRNKVHEPYLAMLDNGSIALTETGSNRVHIFEPDQGTSSVLMTDKRSPQSLNAPRGLVFNTMDSSLYIVNSGQDRITRIRLTP